MGFGRSQDRGTDLGPGRGNGMGLGLGLAQYQGLSQERIADELLQ